MERLVRYCISEKKAGVRKLFIVLYILPERSDRIFRIMDTASREIFSTNCDNSQFPWKRNTMDVALCKNRYR